MHRFPSLRRITLLLFVAGAFSPLFSIRAQAATADLRREIEAKLVETQRKAAPDLKVGKATCPAALSKPVAKLASGLHRCAVLVEGVSVPYDVTLRMGGLVTGGSYTLQNAKAVIDMKKLAGIASTVADNPKTAKISCGTSRVIVAAPGATLKCTVVEGEAIETLTFVVKDLRGMVSLVT